MRALSFIPFGVMAALVAQAPPQAAMPRQMGAAMAEFQPTFKLLRWKVDQPSTFESQEDILPLLDDDLTIVGLNDRSKARWGGDAAWGANPRWGVGSPEGKLLQTWDREPTPQEVTALMRSQGWSPFRERLDTFLRTHPEQGEAHLALLRALSPKLMRTLKEVPGGAGALKADGSQATQWTVDADLRSRFMDELKKLIQLPGWPRQQTLRQALTFLLNNDDLASAVLDTEVRRDLREGVASELKRTPSDPQLWNLYANLCGPGDASAAKALLMGMDGPPGLAWPPPAAAVPMGDILGQAEDWSGLEGLSSWAVGQVKHTPGASASGFFAKNPEGSWIALGLWASWEQGRHEEVFRQVEEQLKTPSAGLLQVLGRLRSNATEDERKRLSDLFRNNGRGSFREAFQTPEPPPPLRVTKVGNPSWSTAFAKLTQHPAFDAWGGDEVAWGDLGPEAEKALKPKLGQGSHWVVMRGETVLASGTELPSALDVAQRLRSLVPPRLEALNAFLKTHPEEEEARRARLALVRSRMPHPRLEMTLLEDARTLRTGFRADEAWQPNPDLWRAPAKRLVPELEAHLAHWPADAATWEAWVEWSSLLTPPGDPTDLLHHLPIFRMREWMGTDAGPLPLDVATRVARRLKEAGRWKDLEAWCRAFWEGGLRQELPNVLGSSGGMRFRDNLGEGALQRLGAGLLQPWIEALDHTQAKARALALRQDLDSVQPGLGQRLLEKKNTPPGGVRSAPVR